jgi:hypothetical protein
VDLTFISPFAAWLTSQRQIKNATIPELGKAGTSCFSLPCELRSTRLSDMRWGREPTVLIRTLNLSSPWGGIVAIFGAYAIALQLVLSSVLATSAAAGGAGQVGATCLHTGGAHADGTRDAPSHPGDDPICPHCGLGCILAGGALVGFRGTLTRWQPIIVAVDQPGARSPSAPRGRVAARPHNPRAPPV